MVDIQNSVLRRGLNARTDSPKAILQHYHFFAFPSSLANAHLNILDYIVQLLPSYHYSTLSPETGEIPVKISRNSSTETRLNHITVIVFF